MIYVLMSCVFMSSSGESCTDIGQYQTKAACVYEMSKFPQTRFEYARCEERKK